MKVVQINTVCGSGSTGKICVDVSKLLTERGVENYIFYAYGDSDYSLGRKYMHTPEVKLAALQSRILGNWGFNSRTATKRLIAMLEQVQPDIVHLHNLHGHNCNLEMLLSYFREKKIRLFWTFHDCWAFTGYCMHYDMIGCDRWKTGCHACPQKREYSWFLDRSRHYYERKKTLFSNLDLTIVTPSHWLAEQVKQSFLKDYPVHVIHNGIDLEIFRPRESDFRKKHGLEDKKILLGVAFGWGPRKGLDVFCELAKSLDDRYKIVLVGTDEKTDKLLPENILSIHRTQNQIELAEIYTAADVFVNPTREENYPTVNMEAIACGTPVITFRTGGSPEILDEKTGIVVEKNDVDALQKAIETMCEENSLLKSDCPRRAEAFEQRACFQNYLSLYL